MQNMNNNLHHKMLFVLLITITLGACDQFAKVTTPKCSDEATLKLVREIISENFVDLDRQLSPQDLEKRLSLTLVHATKLEENIRKYSCEATLTATNGTEQHEMNLSFESQLDDDSNHLVKVLNVSAFDAEILNTLLSRQDAPPAKPDTSTNSNQADAVNNQPNPSNSTDELEQALEEAAALYALQMDLIPSTDNLKYTDARNLLQNNGYEPDVDSDIEAYPHTVAGDKAACGNAGCSIPWRGENVSFCVGVGVNDNISQEQWITGKAQSCEQ